MKEQILEKELETFTKDEAEEIAKENIGLIHHIIGTLNCTNFDYTELYDAGLFGYAKAINSFNKNKEILFSTYACNCIRNEILFYMKREMRHIVNDISLNKQIACGDHKDLLLEDIIEDDKSEINKIEKIMINNDNAKFIKKALEHLDEDEQFVLIKRFGLFGEEQMKQKEIAKALNISQARVSKTEKFSLKKLSIYLLKDISK